MVSDQDRDLLSRLNALKKSPIELDHVTHAIESPSSKSDKPLDPTPARALGDELANRFKSLHSPRASSHREVVAGNSGASAGSFGDLGGNERSFDEDVEDLLASLGPEESWKLQQDDKSEIDELLDAARDSLQNARSDEHPFGDDSSRDQEVVSSRSAPPRMPAIDVSVFQAGSELQDDQDGASNDPKPPQPTIDAEADDILQRIMDEIRSDPPPPYEEEHNDRETNPNDHESPNQTSSTSFNLLSTPQKDPIPPPPPASTSNPDPDSDLTARFASLSLPSVPTTLKSSKPGPSQSQPQLDDEEIDTWCIICLSDATLSCPSCDNELYCTNCWLEGHRGPDAGMEERTHKAVLFVKDAKKNKGKEKVGRRMVGAS